MTVGDDLGVTRQIGEQGWKLQWPEIGGYVVISGGIALVPREGGKMIEIPRFLDDYSGCIRGDRGAWGWPLTAEQIEAMLKALRRWRLLRSNHRQPGNYSLINSGELLTKT